MYLLTSLWWRQANWTLDVITRVSTTIRYYNRDCALDRVHNSRRPLDRLFAFLTLWPWPFDLIVIDGRGIVTKFGDFSLSRFGFTVRTDRQTDRQTESQTLLNALVTRLLSARVNTILTFLMSWRSIQEKWGSLIWMAALNAVKVNISQMKYWKCC